MTGPLASRVVRPAVAVKQVGVWFREQGMAQQAGTARSHGAARFPLCSAWLPQEEGAAGGDESD